LVLLEPDRRDETIFFTNIFSYADRKALCEHAYQATRSDLYQRRAELEPLLAKRDMALRLDVLQDKGRTLEDSIRPRFHSHAPSARELSAALDRLDRLLDGSQADA
jgi:hypothetical protein